MTPEKFIAQWTKNDLTEKAGAQPFIEDLCELLQIDKPRSSDDFCYEKGAIKDTGGQGWANVWKRDCFGWENKKPGRDLSKALAQLREYSGNLGNPPLLVVCDRDRIEIHTAFRGYPDEPRSILLKNIGEPANLQILKWVFTDPDKLKPLKSNAAITAEAAGQFAKLAKDLRERGIDPQHVAHFLTQCIFCMFAEDEGLLHNSPTDNAEIFTGILKAARAAPDKAADRIKLLFTAMQKKGGIYGNDDIAWFNGGLFKTIQIPPLTAGDVAILYDAAATLDWRAIDPTIFGTLFERGLDPTCRAQLGAHYTDVATINKLIEPLITRPLSAEWQEAKAQMAMLIAKSGKTTTGKNYKAAANLYHGYLERLRNFRVLDAACGSGNFLYLALHALKDLEHRAQIDAEQMGLPKQLDIMAGTDNILGIETNDYAAELARLTVWIGDIQWCQRNGRPINKNPILRSLDGIQHRDALLNPDGSETDWPDADVIVGNPPFLGDKVMRGELGDAYVTTLRNCYKGRVPGGADLVCYWFDKARMQIEQGKTHAAGLVSTNSIRGGSNRKVLESICASLTIFDAWPDEDWFDAGTAVRVSLVCFAGGLLDSEIPPRPPFTKGRPRGIYPNTPRLAGQPVAVIHADLTRGDGDISMDLTKAKSQQANKSIAFMGITKVGSFDFSGEIARSWTKLPNPNGKSNIEVIRPSWNGLDVTRRNRDTWIIDFGYELLEADAALFETPFEYAKTNIYPERQRNNREAYRLLWWRHGEPRPGLRKLLAPLNRFIVTPEVSKHRVFVWVPSKVLPDKNLQVITRSDDTTFGILHSRFHELWALSLGTSLEDRPRYTPTTCFETFPFPTGLTPADTAPNTQEDAKNVGRVSSSEPNPTSAAAPQPAIIPSETQRPYAQTIAEAAFKLNQLRENWLNPPEWVDWVITPEEAKAGFPHRPVAKPGHEADLKKRTLTNLYNAKPAWLVNAHQALDRAVALAYGWNDYTPEMSDAEILQRLLQLNLARAAHSQDSEAVQQTDSPDTQIETKPTNKVAG
ncbi:class I SAM-dependent DNA methyltransferase [Methylomonas sp. LW13]|uniref:class I SAM-dependent DNA methyltransferase n=1 Tax=unclassified Methylomonas TaxID=2608980 RepID=UPI001020DA36|nr:DNA methyltransferase [Methylomonas sp. LW13]QBC29988.1 class I SAM-dependent DNA methyltransferase [Methylomonas sp. LW13]